MITQIFKKSVGQYQKEGFTYSADGHQFKLDRINNFLISVNNPKTTKDGAKIFLKNDIANEMKKIIKANPRSQINEKKYMLDVYRRVARVFDPFLKSDNEQPKLETQESDDE